MANKIFIDSISDTAFQQNGYVVLDLLKGEDISELQKAFADVEEQHDYDYIASVVLHDFEMRRSIHENLRPVFERRLLHVLDNYKLVVGSFVAKRSASENGKFPLHQDPTFVEEDEHIGISIWCPLVDVDMHNGCLGVLPGSHHLKNLYRTASMLPYPELVEIIESMYMQYIPMKAGQVLFMNTRMIHGSPPNLSAAVRPVAAGVAIPSALPLLCCYVDEVTDPYTTNIYQVPDDFYLRHIMQSLPKEGQQYKTVPRQVEAMTKENIATLKTC